MGVSLSTLVAKHTLERLPLAVQRVSEAECWRIFGRVCQLRVYVRALVSGHVSDPWLPLSTCQWHTDVNELVLPTRWFYVYPVKQNAVDQITRVFPALPATLGRVA